MLKRFRIETKERICLATNQIYRACPEICHTKGYGIAILLRRGGEGGGGAVSINENADPTVRDDFVQAVPRIAAFGRPKDLNAFQTALLPKSLTMIVENGRFVLGTWQGIYLAGSNPSEKSTNYVHDLTLIYIKLTSKTRSNRMTYEANTRGVHRIDTTIRNGLFPEKSDDERQRKNQIICLASLHTSASMQIADRIDGFEKQFESTLNRIVPERWNKEFLTHTYEGPDDMPGHLKSSLAGVGFLAPADVLVPDGPIGINLNEHRNCGGWGGGHRRNIVGLRVDSRHIKASETLRMSSGNITDRLRTFVEAALKRTSEDERRPSVLSLTVLDAAAAIKIVSSNERGEDLFACFRTLGGGVNGGATLAGKTAAVPCLGSKLELGEDQALHLVSAPRRTAIAVHAALIVSEDKKSE